MRSDGGQWRPRAHLRLHHAEVDDGVADPGGGAQQRHEAHEHHCHQEDAIAVLARAEPLHRSRHERGRGRGRGGGQRGRVLCPPPGRDALLGEVGAGGLGEDACAVLVHVHGLGPGPGAAARVARREVQGAAVHGARGAELDLAAAARGAAVGGEVGNLEPRTGEEAEHDERGGAEDAGEDSPARQHLGPEPHPGNKDVNEAPFSLAHYREMLTPSPGDDEAAEEDAGAGAHGVAQRGEARVGGRLAEVVLQVLGEEGPHPGECEERHHGGAEVPHVHFVSEQSLGALSCFLYKFSSRLLTIYYFFLLEKRK